jgi:hypothetical protein
MSCRPVHIGAAAPSSLITLNCWVLSDDPDHVFPASEESVGALKKAIKEETKPVFHCIPTYRLDLWKASQRIVQRVRCLSISQVSIPPGDPHAVLQGLGDPERINGALKLSPTTHPRCRPSS